jgi:hypothetical protein
MQIHKHRAAKWLKQVLSNQRYSNELMGDLAKKNLDKEDAFEVGAHRQQLFVVKKLHICLSIERSRSNISHLLLCEPSHLALVPVQRMRGQVGS